MKKLIATICVVVLSTLSSWAQATGGPVVLMGIDAEDGGVGGHGPIATYETVVNNILLLVNNNGSGILVVGGGKNAGDNVTTFWNRIAADTGVPVTFVNGAANITAQSFAGFALIAVVSDVSDTPSGGLTSAENTAIGARAADIAAHVNNGGGLLGFSSGFGASAFLYVTGIGADCAGNSGFTFNFPSQYSNITPTSEGLAIGINDSLDVCCWHDEFTAFPSFLNILATNPNTGNPAAIGGFSVFIPTALTCPAAATVECDSHDGKEVTLTAHVEDPGCSDVTVTWEVDGSVVKAEVLPGTGTPISADVSYTQIYAIGIHTVKITLDNGIDPATTCETTVTVQDTTPPSIICPANIVVGNEPGQCSAVVEFSVTASDLCGDVTLVCTPPSGSVFPKGDTLVTCIATDEAGLTAECSFTVTVQDTEAPVAECVPTVNPAGNNVPTAGENPKSGQNPDGFYQLLGQDNCDPNPGIYIQDSASGFVAGPFQNGDQVKLVQAPGVTPNQKPMAGVIVAQIQLKGDALIYAADADGNASRPHPCLVPPLPK